MSFADTSLSCCACAVSLAYDPFVHRCPECGEALEFAPSSTATLDEAAPSMAAGSGGGMWRYRSLLPAVDLGLVEARVFMGEGGTPLLRAPGIERAVDCGPVWLKDESLNPTGSFKDRGTAFGVAALAGLGFAAVGTVSTGNMARSVAAYAARAGMSATIWLGADIAKQKLAPIAVHGARLLRFDAPYGDIYAASLEWSVAHDVPFINSDAALRVAGQKTIAYEIAEQLAGKAPDWLIVPTSSGGNFSAIAQGLQEAADGGFLEGQCRLVAVQTEECAPIVGAWDSGADEPITVLKPSTIAGAISNPSPPSGARALRWLRKTDGVAIAVSDAEIAAGQLRLAALTGRFVQPASAASLVALEHLAGRGVIGADDTVVLLLTGAGGNAPAPAVDIDPPRALDDSGDFADP